MTDAEHVGPPSYVTLHQVGQFWQWKAGTGQNSD